MTIARCVEEVLRDHVVIEYEAIDRMHLNVYVPQLETGRSLGGYLRACRRHQFASTTAMAPMFRGITLLLQAAISSPFDIKHPFRSG